MSKYWAVCIKLSPSYDGEGNPPKWWASLNFQDSLHAEDGHITGTMNVAYALPDPAKSVEILIREAQAMGIELRSVGSGDKDAGKLCTLVVPGDGEGDVAEFLPADWRESLGRVAQQLNLGWYE